MRCSRCSNDIPDGNSFCSGCGLKIRASGAAPQPPGSQQPYIPPTPPPQYVAPPRQGAPGEVPYSPPTGSPGQPSPYYAQQQPPSYGLYPPQGPGGGPVYGAGSGGHTATPFDRDSLIQVIAIVYVCLYFLVSTVVILSNSSGGALRVLDAAAILGIFAALAVPGYVLLQRGEYDPLGVCVMIAAGGAGLLLVISSFAGNAGFAKFSAVIGGVSLVGTQTALLLFMKANKQWFRYAQYAAIGVAWLAGLVAAITVLRATNTSTLTGSVTGLAALGKATGIFIIMDICASVVAILLWRLALKYGG